MGDWFADWSARLLAGAPAGTEVVSIEVYDMRSNMVAVVRNNGREVVLSGWERGPIPVDRLGEVAARLGRNYSQMFKTLAAPLVEPAADPVADLADEMKARAGL